MKPAPEETPVSRMRRMMYDAQRFYADMLATQRAAPDLNWRPSYEKLVQVLDILGAELEKLEAAEAADTEGYIQAAWAKAMDGSSRESLREVARTAPIPPDWTPDKHPFWCLCVDCEAKRRRERGY